VNTAKKLLSYLKSLPKEAREPFAKRCGTSLGFLKLIAYGAKPCSPELAVAIDRESHGQVAYRELCPEPKIDWSYIEMKGAHQPVDAVSADVKPVKQAA
jgi:DNA-binding transcriptional regulator YdaS (Cro superfamily)